MADKLPLELKYGSTMKDGNKPDIVDGTIYFDTSPDRTYQLTQEIGSVYIDINGVRYALVPVYDKVIKYNENTNTIILE